ncbi:MerR family transcriptional regulator [Mycolicibacterium sp. CH28]|uniref:MerR family transcriptional regulator n=1 Tax=Mycolicibacterium sp. CH28 TaxID=2512237 RepID=UPI001F383886|nr:MerR family transcriptional regulator [Mycolicibacterium sp. CH28]
MYSIGAFAELGGVSLRMLRHYDSIGLLTPAHVDPATGRRSYGNDQLAQLNRIVALKELGFTLQQVKRLLNDGVAPAELSGMLRMRSIDLESRLLRDQQTLDRVRARLRLIESESTMPITNVQLKSVPLQRVIGLSERIDPDTDADVEALFDRVIARMANASADRAAPISWRHHVEDDTFNLYVGYVAPTATVLGLEVHDLPAATVASVVRRGAVDGMNEAHQAIARWAEANGHTTSVRNARWREIYLETNDADYSDWLIEVQLEL